MHYYAYNIILQVTEWQVYGRQCGFITKSQLPLQLHK